MSLDWDVTETAAHKEGLYPKVDGYQNPVTNALIWMTMSVGMGSITEENADEFYGRARLVQALDGAKDALTPEDIRAHIGLRTNVSPETRTQWYKRVIGYTVGLHASTYRRTVAPPVKATG